ncbi:MAG: aminoacyl-tRNA hydrolase [Rhizobiales bacterium]|nr:aminoacyl-tRNA hydrolase [Hyphomicrobiales bacterium]
MLLFVGLGNPGARYAANRHNIGFMVVEAIAKRHNIGPFRKRFQGVSAEGPIGSVRALLLLPGTFMNESGRAVAEAAHFYKLGLDSITVFHDEIELTPGKVRVKIGGGIAGHNGLRSITAHVGNDYRRVRIGVGHPGVKDLVHPHVLSDFAKVERPWVEALCDIISDNAELLAKGQDASFQNKVHLSMSAKGFFDDKESDEPRAAGPKAPKDNPRET